MFWNIFYNLCKEKGIKPNTVCKELGFSNATATHWKNGKSPNGDTLCLLADYFDISIDYLFGREEKKIQISECNSSSVSNGLDEQQQKLIDNYNKLNTSAQKALVDYSDFMTGKSENLKDTSDTDKLNT